MQQFTLESPPARADGGVAYTAARPMVYLQVGGLRLYIKVIYFQEIRHTGTMYAVGFQPDATRRMP